MTTRRHALALLASIPVVASTRAAWADAAIPASEPALRTVALPAHGRVRTVQANTPFWLVGLSWSGPAPQVTELRVRRGGVWSEWITVSPVDGAAASASEPVWTGRANAVQVRALRNGRAAGGVSVVLVDPGANPAHFRPKASPVPGLDVIPRSEWGADESVGGCGLPDYAEPVRAIAVHHTAGSNDYGPKDSAGIVRSIYLYHAKTLGWCDIGYHALVDRFGQIFEGRAGGLDRAVVGAHAGGFNLHTSGVAMMGTFTDAKPPQAMQDGLVAFLDWKLACHGLDPKGHTVLVSRGGGTSRYPPGAEVTVPVIFGHRDVGETACPGDHGYKLLPDLRKLARAILPPH